MNNKPVGSDTRSHTRMLVMLITILILGTIMTGTIMYCCMVGLDYPPYNGEVCREGDNCVTLAE